MLRKAAKIPRVSGLVETDAVALNVAPATELAKEMDMTLAQLEARDWAETRGLRNASKIAAATLSQRPVISAIFPQNRSLQILR